MTPQYEDALRVAMTSTAPPRKPAQWNITGTRKPSIDRAQVLDLSAQGIRCKVIARLVGCSEQHVTEIRRQARRAIA